MHKIEKIKDIDVLDYYAQSAVLKHYEEATIKVGLWESERIVFTKNFPDRSKSILELGCGCGRIAFGLQRLGYSKIQATDYSPALIEVAHKIAQKKQISADLAVVDARAMPVNSASLDGIIFGFNGLMQIPGRSSRLAALKEINRVLVPGGKFIFTSHDRGMPKWKKFWQSEKKLWRKNSQNSKLIEFGDRFDQTPNGKLYLHVPEISEVKKDLVEAGLKLEWDKLRSSITDESELVKKYSDDCRFWVARKPEKN